MMIDGEIREAKPPIKMELGGDYYYKCFWLKCNQTIKSDWNYCPYCGTKILWEGENGH